jgi:hypothetical protein
MAIMKKMKNPEAYDKAWSQEQIVSPLDQQFSPQPQANEPQVNANMLPGFDQQAYENPPLDEALPRSVNAPVQEISPEMIPQKRFQQSLRGRTRRFDNAQAKQRGELIYG